MAKKKQSNLETWPWPYLRTNFGGAREFECPCGVGHGGIHGCCSEGCCSHPSFKKKVEEDGRLDGRINARWVVDSETSMAHLIDRESGERLGSLPIGMEDQFKWAGGEKHGD